MNKLFLFLILPFVFLLPLSCSAYVYPTPPSSATVSLSGLFTQSDITSGTCVYMPCTPNSCGGNATVIKACSASVDLESEWYPYSTQETPFVVYYYQLYGTQFQFASNTIWRTNGLYTLFNYALIPSICASQTTQSTCEFYPDCTWSSSTCSYSGSTALTLPSNTDYTFTTQDFGVLGNMFRDVLVALFLPSATNTETQFNSVSLLLQQKLPFAYIYAIQNLWSQTASELTTGAYPTVKIDDPLNPSGEQLTLLDLGATRDMMGTSTFDTFRTIMGYLFWLGGFFFIWETLHKGNNTKL